MTDSVVVLSALAVILWALAVGFVFGQWFERDSGKGRRRAADPTR